MKLDCKTCKDVRDAVVKCAEATGNFVCTCAMCAAVMFAVPVDHLHSHDREPVGPLLTHALIVRESTATDIVTPLPWPERPFKWRSLSDADNYLSMPAVNPEVMTWHVVGKFSG
jgi:hypothetical protein